MANPAARAAAPLRPVAALYVDPRGVYPDLPGVEAWDEKRDARKYRDLMPVVAHPPCGPYSKLRRMYLGEEHDCFALALEDVRLVGGVLEHPAYSTAFKPNGVPTPADATDHCGGRTYYVEQVWWGHACRKPTWLYVVRVDQTRVMRDIRAAKVRGGTITHYAGGSRQSTTRQGSPIPPGIKAASAEIRRRTPPAFAAWLVALARASVPA